MLDMREIADALAPETQDRLRLRKGVVSTGGGTVNSTVFIGGSSVASPVYFPKLAPANGSVCWVLTQGALIVGLM